MRPDEFSSDKSFIQFFLSSRGLDVPFIINECFLGYKHRKADKKLYEESATVPTNLIKLYYILNPTEIEFDDMKKSFVSKYVKNESEIEGINDTNIHGKEEIAGLDDVYTYLHSEEIENDFSVYSLMELNRKLFSHAPHPECAGIYRNFPAYLPGTGLDLCDFSMISREVFFLRDEVDQLHKAAKEIRQYGDVDDLLNFLDRCVELKCKLIWIHPFPDGNGRTIRAFINKLLEDSGLPPIYIKTNERTEYHTAMNTAIGDGDLTAIKAFYRYKICDSIIDLDINKRLKQRNSELFINKQLKKKNNSTGSNS